ncbi:MAG: hypothetical protein WCC67_09565, partial [Candidatus Acidiferrales bacterium]
CCSTRGGENRRCHSIITSVPVLISTAGRASAQLELCRCIEFRDRLLEPMTDSHGRYPPAKAAAAEERRRQRQIILQLLHLPWNLFIDGLRLMGLIEGSADWDLAVTAWREFHSRD